jgi:hypothetical protein
VREMFDAAKDCFRALCQLDAGLELRPVGRRLLAVSVTTFLFLGIVFAHRSRWDTVGIRKLVRTIRQADVWPSKLMSPCYKPWRLTGDGILSTMTQIRQTSVISPCRAAVPALQPPPRVVGLTTAASRVANSRWTSCRVCFVSHRTIYVDIMLRHSDIWSRHL